MVSGGESLKTEALQSSTGRAVAAGTACRAPTALLGTWKRRISMSPSVDLDAVSLGPAPSKMREGG